jgi:methionyl-tRNA formyltransferase
MKIGVLASGRLGALCLEACKELIKPSFIATDSNSLNVIEFSENNKIPIFIGNPRNKRLSTFLGKESYDFFLSINYLFLLEEDAIKKAKYPINFHGSLLPKYRGRTPHIWAIINNEKVSGVTAHIIDIECDSGPIVLQNSVDISELDTGADILTKYENIYPEMIFQVLAKYNRNDLQLRVQDNSKATYYGKRTPEDGNINWNWQKERIRNWVRAQAKPYPGAFGWLDGTKIIIDEIAFSDLGYNNSDPNGLILCVNPSVIVKTCNGAIELRTVRKGEYKYSIGKVIQ